MNDINAACSQEEVNKVMDSAKAAQKLWAKTPLWKRAELLHKAAAILKEHKAEIAECLVKEVAKPAKDAVTEVHIVLHDGSVLTSQLLFRTIIFLRNHEDNLFLNFIFLQ